MKFEKKTIAIILVATIGVSLLIGLASATGRADPLTQIIDMLLGIDAKLDTITSNTENAILFYQNGVVLQPSGETGDRIDYNVLEYEEGKAYHVHMTGIIGSIYAVGFYVSAGPARYTAITMYHLEGPAQENVNLDFVCTWLSITLINRAAAESNAVAILTIQYQNCTNVVSMP